MSRTNEPGSVGRECEAARRRSLLDTAPQALLTQPYRKGWVARLGPARCRRLLDEGMASGSRDERFRGALLPVRKGAQGATTRVMERPTLYLSRDIHDDWLSAYEFGTVDDGQPAENWLGLSEQVGFLMASPFGPVVGFCVKDFSELDLDDEDHEPMWTGPRFDVPVLGLRDVCAADICLAAQAYLGDEPTVNRAFFHAAMDEHDPKAALKLWRVCLECGDLMAHYGLGYTLCELGRHREAYNHLRAYTEIVPSNAWAWCWLGKVCASLGELGEARAAYGRALELEEAGAEETDAAEYLEKLGRAA